MKKQVFVVGGGAAGMMAAISAAEEGAEVTILEHNDRVGKKILSTGNGRCNFTNVNQSSKCYRSDNKGFAWNILSLYPYETTRAFFERLGICAKEKNGGLYPFSEQASAVLDVLRMELDRLAIRILTGEHVMEIHPEQKCIKIQCQNEEKKIHRYQADAVVLATGSKAAPKLGSDGSGYTIAKKLGHKMVPIVPALVQLKCKEGFYKALAGVRVYGKVTLLVNEKAVASDKGELQLTAYGISGIPVFQVSRYGARAIYEKKKVRAVLDFMPDLSESEVLDYVRQRILDRPEKKMEDFWTGVFHKKLSQVMLKVANVRADQRANQLTDTQIQRLVRTVKSFSTEITETNAFDQAQICAGGIDTREICPQTMESRLVPGVFLAGELVDVDGICGGYNLQWAWSSGYLAGKGAAHVTN